MSSRRRAVSAARAFVALIAAIALAVIGGTLIGATAAGAASTDKAQLSLSGIASADDPTGGSVLGVHPGDTVVLSASTVPTAGLDKLGLGGLVSGLLNSLASFQVTADFAALPGGANNTVLKGKATKSFRFTQTGTYSFTWSAQSIGLLGNAVPINLDGNQLSKAGIKLNAKNQYVGSIVVADNPPKGGISIQLPGVSIQPSLPGVTLPKLGLPGVTTPTIPTSVPNLNPGKSTGTTKSTGKVNTPTGALPVPAMVVPQGTGGVYGDPGNDPLAPLSGTSVDAPVTVPADIAAAPGVANSVATSTSKTAAGPATKPASSDRVVNLASSRPDSSGLPVVLAVVAIIALVLVAGTYARMFLLRKPPSS